MKRDLLTRWAIDVAWLCLAICLGACGSRSGLFVDDAGHSADARIFDAPSDTSFDARSFPRRCRVRPQPVDIAVILDGSGSMFDDPPIVEEMKTLIRELVAPPDRDGDGAIDWAPVEDLHYAVADTSRDGLFSSTRPSLFADPVYWQSVREGDELAPVLANVEEISQFDDGGEEVLFAVALRALLTWRSEFPYRMMGEVIDAQQDFLRPDSVLVIIIVTDDDDISPCTGLPSDRCMGTPPLMSIATAEEAFIELGTGHDLVVAAIAGLPIGATDPRDAVEGCRVGDRRVLPSPRVAQLVSNLAGSLHSICAPDHRDLARELSRRVGQLACDE